MTKLTTLYIQILDKVNTHTLYNRGTTREGGGIRKETILAANKAIKKHHVPHKYMDD